MRAVYGFDISDIRVALKLFFKQRIILKKNAEIIKSIQYVKPVIVIQDCRNANIIDFIISVKIDVQTEGRTILPAMFSFIINLTEELYVALFKLLSI